MGGPAMAATRNGRDRCAILANSSDLRGQRGLPPRDRSAQRHKRVCKRRNTEHVRHSIHRACKEQERNEKKRTLCCRVTQPSHLMQVSGRLALRGGVCISFPFFPFIASDSPTASWVGCLCWQRGAGFSRCKPMQFWHHTQVFSLVLHPIQRGAEE